MNRFCKNILQTKAALIALLNLSNIHCSLSKNKVLRQISTFWIKSCAKQQIETVDLQEMCVWLFLKLSAQIPIEEHSHIRSTYDKVLKQWNLETIYVRNRFQYSDIFWVDCYQTFASKTIANESYVRKAKKAMQGPWIFQVCRSWTSSTGQGWASSAMIKWTLWLWNTHIIILMRNFDFI